MDTAKLEKQVQDAGKTTAMTAWLVMGGGVLLAVLSYKDVLVAALNLVMVGGLGVWMLIAGKKAQRQAEARDFPGFRKTLGRLTVGIVVISVLALLLGGKPGILIILVAVWNQRAVGASKQLENPAAGLQSVPAQPSTQPEPAGETPTQTM
jgi:hypothetical protein